MAKTFYVYSTLSNDQRYTAYNQGMGDLPIEAGSVTIKGGAGVADKRLFTPLGVVTAIDEAQLELLKTVPAFEAHQKNGFITVRDRKVDEEKAAVDMAGRDGSDPLVDADFTEKEAPKANKRK